MQKKVNKTKKLSLNEPVGLLNICAAGLSIFTLFFGLFNAEGLEVLGYPGPFLILFILCAYIAQARLSGYKFSKYINGLMILIPVCAIIASVWGISNV